MKRLMLINGPNLNLLGTREPDVYGSKTLLDIEEDLRNLLHTYNWKLDAFQSNHEGELIDTLQKCEGIYDGIIFNPAGYTHTSVALRDAISAISVPVIEVHISNVHKRESFRHKSLIAPVCWGQIVGFGVVGYRLAAQAFLDQTEKQ